MECEFCGNLIELSTNNGDSGVCGICKNVPYCDKNCQKADWFQHSKICTTICHSVNQSSKFKDKIVVANPGRDRPPELTAISIQLNTLFNEIWSYSVVKMVKPVPTGVFFNYQAEKENILYFMYQTGQIRRFAVESEGFLKVLDSTNKPFFDISTEISTITPLKGMPFEDERGLLSATFHPSKPNLLYVLYSTGSKNPVDPTNEWGPHTGNLGIFLKDPESSWQKIYVHSWDEPQFNHNGGRVLFDPSKGDILYLSLGDGGGFNDEHGKKVNGVHFGNAQNLTSVHGKILRFKVASDGKSLKPHKENSQLFQRETLAKQPVDSRVWAYGLRNPWRMFFPPTYIKNPLLKNKLFVADVGQNTIEMVKEVAAGENHGWKVREGSKQFEKANKELIKLISQTRKHPIDPVIEYERSHGIAIVGAGILSMTLGRHTTHYMVIADYSGKILYSVFENKLRTDGKTSWSSPQIIFDLNKDRGETDSSHNYFIHSVDQNYKTGDIFVSATRPDLKQNVLLKIDEIILAMCHEYSMKGERTFGNSQLSCDTCRNRMDYRSIPSAVHLSRQEIKEIFKKAEGIANKTKSSFRKSRSGASTVKMHIAIKTTEFPHKTYLHSMIDAWIGSEDIAIAKAFTALSFSSNENALTSRAIGVLAQPGQPLFGIGNSNRQIGAGIITFPGGIPIYKKDILVGAIGVSGDGVDEDEIVAYEAVKENYDAPEWIKASSEIYIKLNL